MSMSDSALAPAPTGTPVSAPLSGFVAAHAIDVELMDAPIDPSWILDGDPRARASMIAQGSDQRASLAVWACTKGRFHWYFGCDEAVYIVDGSVTVKAPDGTVRHLKQGDMAQFPNGTWFEWTVHDHVRKVAFCHDIVPPPFRLPLKIHGKLTRLALRLFRRLRRPVA